MSQPAYDPGEQEEVILRFINPFHRDQSISDTHGGRGAGLLKGDGIISALGRPISTAGLAKLVKAVGIIDETEDSKGRVYRMRVTMPTNNTTTQYRLGLLDDGQNWGAMSTAELFLKNSENKTFIILEGACIVTLTSNGVEARDIAMPARLKDAVLFGVRKHECLSYCARAAAERIIEVGAGDSNSTNNKYAQTMRVAGRPPDTRKRKSPRGQGKNINAQASKTWVQNTIDPHQRVWYGSHIGERLVSWDSDSSYKVVMTKTPPRSSTRLRPGAGWKSSGDSEESFGVVLAGSQS